jgi:hypothetical protein
LGNNRQHKSENTFEVHCIYNRPQYETRPPLRTRIHELGRAAQSDKQISYSVDKKSVQYVVIDLARQVGLGYNWEKSATQTDPERRRFLNDVAIVDKPFHEAMKEILNPLKLRYEVEDGKVVLYRQ